MLLKLLGVVLISTISGFLVALGTDLLIGRKKAHTFPGGSLMIGYMIGLGLESGLAPTLLGALFGIGGWILYRRMVPIKSDK